MQTLAVLITYYNEGALLRQCIASVLNQSYPPNEILVYDDASEIPAKDFLDPAWQVKLIRGEKNSGPSHGRNKLLAESRADLVHFHDADDWFHPEWAKKVRESFNDEVDAVFTEISSFMNGNLYRERVMGLEYLINGEDLVRFCLLHSMLVPSGTYRRKLLTELGGYNTEMWQSEDYEFHIRLAAARIRYKAINEPLVHIRLRTESRSQNHEEVWTCRMQALRLASSYISSEYYPTIAQAAIYIGSKLFRMGLREDARKAFQFAVEIGPPSYLDSPPFYRHVARLLGPEAAEWISLAYRQALPEPLRRWVRNK